MRLGRIDKLLTVILLKIALLLPISVGAQRTQKPVLHGRHWAAITGKPLGSTAGVMIFQMGSIAVDAACAMLCATCTMWDDLGWGGETQDQNLLQFFLNMVEFGMNVQEATEAANIISYQMRNSFGEHESKPGRLTLNQSIPPWTRVELIKMGYELNYQTHTSGPINAIFF